MIPSVAVTVYSSTAYLISTLGQLLNLGLSKEGVQAQFLISGQETIIETASVDVTSGDNMIARLKKIIGLAADDGPN